MAPLLVVLLDTVCAELRIAPASSSFSSLPGTQRVGLLCLLLCGLVSAAWIPELPILMFLYTGLIASLFGVGYGGWLLYQVRQQHSLACVMSFRIRNLHVYWRTAHFLSSHFHAALQISQRRRVLAVLANSPHMHTILKVTGNEFFLSCLFPSTELVHTSRSTGVVSYILIAFNTGPALVV